VLSGFFDAKSGVPDLSVLILNQKKAGKNCRHHFFISFFEYSLRCFYILMVCVLLSLLPSSIFSISVVTSHLL